MSPLPSIAVAALGSVHSSHTIRVAAQADAALMFFTPEGETHWVPDWTPRYLNSADCHTREGLVFTTGEADEFTIWLVSRFNPAERVTQYVRTTPALRTGTVEVACAPVGDSACDVTVTYALTALTPAGLTSLGAYRGAAFMDMIEGWATLIHHRLPELLGAKIGERVAG